jgi:predicted O-methyltransferase YrrM
MELAEAKKISNEIDGWLSDNEGELLFNLAKNCKGEGKIVEIGSWKGKSTVWLASGSKSGKNVKVYAIDPHTGSSEHKEKYKESKCGRFSCPISKDL